jgi:hypothetical protein
MLSYRTFCSYGMKENAIIKIFDPRFSKTLTMDRDS